MYEKIGVDSLNYVLKKIRGCLVKVFAKTKLGFVVIKFALKQN